MDGAVKQSGVLAVGGDHITNDISIGLKIPTARAEKLKVDEGNVTLGTAFPGETILLKDETGFAGREIERESLNQIIHYRLRETLEIVKRQIEADQESPLCRSGSFHYRRVQRVPRVRTLGVGCVWDAGYHGACFADGWCDISV